VRRRHGRGPAAAARRAKARLWRNGGAAKAPGTAPARAARQSPVAVPPARRPPPSAPPHKPCPRPRRCGAACLSRLLAVPLPALSWSTVSQVLRLPHAQLAARDAKPLVAACLDRLQGDFGDLEAVASAPPLLARFAALPFQAVLQLLLDERSAAASENTALVLAHAWLAAQPPGAGGRARLVRLGHARMRGAAPPIDDCNERSRRGWVTSRGSSRSAPAGLTPGRPPPRHYPRAAPAHARPQPARTSAAPSQALFGCRSWSP
jgi:hypothetical protein